MSLVVNGVTLTDIVVNGVVLDRLYVDNAMVFDKWARQRVSFPTLSAGTYTAKYDGTAITILASSSSYVEVIIPVLFDISKLEIMYKQDTSYFTSYSYTDITKDSIRHSVWTSDYGPDWDCNTVWSKGKTVNYIEGLGGNNVRIGGVMYDSSYSFSRNGLDGATKNFYAIKDKNTGKQLTNIGRTTIELESTREAAYTYSPYKITNFISIVRV